jgi:hypothetical protein
MPTFNTPGQFLSAAIDSLLAQHYERWQLCIVDDASSEPEVAAILQYYARTEARIDVQWRHDNGGIAAATNDALELARGDFIAFMDHDDVLPAHALLLLVDEIRSHGGCKLFYSDSDNLDGNGQRCNPYFKPGWNYELFLGQNYLNHLTVCRGNLVRELGGLRQGFNGSQDYDFLLRAIEVLADHEIRHIPAILYHWRIVGSSVSRQNLAGAARMARLAIAEHLSRTGQQGRVAAAADALIYNRVQWRVGPQTPRVAIVLYAASRELLAASRSNLEHMTRYADLQFVEVLQKPATDRAVRWGNGFNTAAAGVDADILCFFQAGLMPEDSAWLHCLVAQLQRPSVALAAASLYSSRGDRLHGPLVIRAEADEQIVTPVCSAGESRSKGYFCRLLLDQRAAAVDAACFAVRRAEYLAVGGADSQLCGLTWLGADLTFKLTQGGAAAVWSAQCRIADGAGSAAGDSATFCAAQDRRRLLELWPQRLQQEHGGNTYWHALEAALGKPLADP